MQNNTKGNYFSERNLNDANKFPRRMSTSGFEYPKDLNYAQYPSNIPSIPEAKYPTVVQPHTYHVMNGDYSKVSEIANQNFFSENNVNLSNRQVRANTTGILDPGFYYNDSSSIPRFSSNPYISQTVAEPSHNQTNLNGSKANYNQSFQSPPNYNTSSNQYNNNQTNSYSQIYPNDNNLQYSQYVLFDLRTNSYQNVMFYPTNTPVIQQEQDINDNNLINYKNGKSQPGSSDYQTLVDLQSETSSKYNYIENPLNMAQLNIERNRFTDFVEEDLMYFLPPELPNNTSEINCAESQSMPSLHGDDSPESDFDTSDDDQLNTVHGEEMLQELKKLSSVFTNIVNLPMSGNNDIVGRTGFQSKSNLSRFKKTRIKERTTVWRMEGFVVQDNLVKIIPDQVLNLKRMDLELLEKFEIDIFNCQFPKQAESQKTIGDPPDCIHSYFRCTSTPIDVRKLKHSSRTNQKYRPSFNALSPNDLSNSLNQQMSSNISNRHSHRKSLQIPLRIPIVWNPTIPIPSPVVPRRNRMFFEPSINCNNKNSRRKRRWSVCGTKLERHGSSHSLRPQNIRQAGDLIPHVKSDITNNYFDNRHSFDLQDFEENNHVPNSRLCSLLESKLDKQLVALKRTVMSFVECNISEIKDEIQSLRDTKLNLEHQLRYYKKKVQIFEHSVRQNLPQEQWELFGIVENTACQK